MLPGWDTFLIGNIPQLDVAAKYGLHAKKENLRPVRETLFYCLDQTTETKAEDSFDIGKYPNQLMNLGFALNEVYLAIADPEVVQDMMLTKNQTIDKTGTFAAMM